MSLKADELDVDTSNKTPIKIFEAFKNSVYAISGIRRFSRLSRYSMPLPCHRGLHNSRNGKRKENSGNYQTFIMPRNIVYW